MTERPIEGQPPVSFRTIPQSTPRLTDLQHDAIHAAGRGPILLIRGKWRTRGRRRPFGAATIAALIARGLIEQVEDRLEITEQGEALFQPPRRGGGDDRR